MLTQRRKNVEMVLLSAGMILLLVITPGRCAMLSTQSVTSPPVVNSSLSPQTENSSSVEPEVSISHRPCHSKDEGFCGNGGQCIYPQDSQRPACICKASFAGQRCMYPIGSGGRSEPELEKVIAIVCGVAMIIFTLMLVVYCCVRKRCTKSTPLLKSTSMSLI
ncbi:protransforming growth factor alpha [Oryzias melastigma]|uniref:Protransforming growth factor alpha-like n=1 Tax=Oryzias melastigma TaxID=30732 RepID=A0A3B3DLT6_ORYME|nr:protransforming growth factor alpha [Oryzias melastigma]